MIRSAFNESTNWSVVVCWAEEAYLQLHNTTTPGPGPCTGVGWGWGGNSTSAADAMWPAPADGPSVAHPPSHDTRHTVTRHEAR